MKDAFEDFIEGIREQIYSSSEDIQPWHSFWSYRPTKDFPPKSIRYPHEYDGSGGLNVACTQTELKASQQRKLVQEWCQVLPTLENVKFLWFSSRVSQPLFEAACQMDNLIGLYIKWSGIKSIDSIPNLKNLRYLHIGSSPSLAPLDPLGELPTLEWLELENIRATSDLRFLSDFTNLKGLAIAGDTNSIKYLWADSLEPLQNLQQLYWLSLPAFTTKDGALMPLAKLGALKYLFLSNKFKMEEFAKLSGARPDVECDRLQPISEVLSYLKCKKCCKNRMVLLTGKGKSLLCVDCDDDRIARHVDAFNEIAYEFRC
jgi:hypothetical protein